MHNHRVSLVPKYEWGWSSDTRGAAIALNQGDVENLWYTRMKMKTPEGASVEVNFKARIEQPQGGVWDVTIQLQHEGNGPEHENQAITQDISLSHDYEFTLSGRDGPTLVRLVLVSFSEFLGSEDSGEK